MRPTILLYDIDGTLISTAGAGRRAMERAFEARFGRSDLCDFRFDGMTDQAILRGGMERAGVDPAAPDYADQVAEMREVYVQTLRDECERNGESFRVHRGVSRSLALVSGRGGFAVGLGTGNFRIGAQMKLDRVGLHGHFAFGGFGDDHIERPRLIHHGAVRGAQALGLPLDQCRVVVIGDTPKDIAAAKAIGADSIGVATGNYTVDDLAAHAPTFAFASLDEEAADRAVIGD